ncbi:MGMT family protein [Schaalia suimastitidis]
MGAALSYSLRETQTYQEITFAIGNPKVSRTVGMANNKNPVTITV